MKELILISGIDCVGKSLTAQMIKNALTKDNGISIISLERKLPQIEKDYVNIFQDMELPKNYFDKPKSKFHR